MDIGDQHYNSISEGVVQTMMYMDRTLMVHTLLHRTYYGVDDLLRWYFAMQHTVWMYNCMPNWKTGISTMEMLTSTKSDRYNLQQAHVWVCTTYVSESQAAE